MANIYSALKLPTGYFRLIKLLPPSLGQVCCQLTVENLHVVGGSFAALSYVWCDDTTSHTIKINGENVQVRPNLFDFLQQAQTQDKLLSAKIFIDAICINQSDLQEKNEQVQLMGRIYENAREVIAWMGSKDPAFEEAVDFTKRDRYSWYGPPASSDVENMTRLLNAKNWKRVWIIQEVLKAKRVSLWCGSRVLCWKELDLFCGHLLNSLWDTNESPAWVLRSPLYQHLMTKRGSMYLEGHHSQTMNEVLWLYATNECTEPRDRVFALLSLGQGGHRLQVDYSLPHGDILVRTLCLFEPEDGLEKVLFAKYLQTALTPPIKSHSQSQLRQNPSLSNQYSLNVALRRFENPDGPLRFRHPVVQLFHQTFVDLPAQIHAATMQLATKQSKSQRTVSLEFIENPHVCPNEHLATIGDSGLILVYQDVGGQFELTGRIDPSVTEYKGMTRIMCRRMPWPAMPDPHHISIKRTSSGLELAIACPALEAFLNLTYLDHFTFSACIEGFPEAIEDIYSIRWADGQAPSKQSWPLSAVRFVQQWYLEVEQAKDEPEIDALTLEQAVWVLANQKINVHESDQLKALNAKNLQDTLDSAYSKISLSAS